MKIRDFLTEARPNTSGHHRLVSSIWNAINGKKPSREAIESFLKTIDNDVAFKKRIQSKARKVNNPGYIWGAIRKRTIAHFTKH